tara:strand:+ start:631 stop:2163 length:1533 start_codon:yes stop_codon:yes gene_type:complete
MPNTTNIDKFGKSHKGKTIKVGNCVFPFKSGRKMVHTCVDGKTGLWCATETDAKGKMLKWAYCPQSKVPKTLSIKPVSGKKSSAKKVVANKKASSKKPVKGERYFEMVDGSHFKYWIISNNGTTVNTQFGKIGSQARELSFYLDSKEDVVKYINKKVAEKLRKGYQEKHSISNRVNLSNKSKINKKSRGASDKSTPKIEAAKIGSYKKCDTKHKSSVWDVKKNGVMLAHTYKDPKTGNIKNPPKGFPKAPNGWYMSEKYDGYRAVWDGQNFYSRAGNLFVVPIWFKAFLPSGIALDGELFLGRECFQQCGIFRRKTPDEAEWKKLDVKYQIFDSPTHPGSFEERQDFIKKLVVEQCKCDKKKLGVPPTIKCPLVFTNQTKVTNEEQVSKYFNKIVKDGAEGVMLRSPGSPYDTKRSSHLLKVKQLFDDECKIIGYKMGTGKYSGLLGSFNCQLVKNPKVKFDISGMNDEIRSSYKKTHPIGTIVTFTYMGSSTSGTPRHPNYLRIRKGKI